MDIRDKIIVIEQGLRAENVSVDDLCRESNVNRSTWSRWKQGKTKPNTRTWDRVEAKLPEAAREALRTAA